MKTKRLLMNDLGVRLLISLFLFICSFSCQTKVDKKPNVVLIMADDLGWADLNCFDPLHRDFYETPNLNRLASEGISFMNAYSNAANCSPTRAALLSGQYYPRQPIYHVGTPGKGKLISAPNGKELPLEKITIAESFKRGGYNTAIMGKWHIGEPPQTGPVQQGFDLNIGGYNAGNPGSWEGAYFKPNNNPYIDDAKDNEYLTDYLIRKAINYITQNKRKPFFLYLPLYTPHSPFQAPDTLVNKYKNKKGDRGHDHPVYAAMLEIMDNNVGKIMDAVHRLGIAENTIIIFCSDNGGRGGYGFLGRAGDDITSNKPLKGGKSTYYEGGIRVPMIIRWTGKIEAGRESNVPVLTFDLYPTLLDACNIAPPVNYVLDGESLMPILYDRKSSLDRTDLYWHFPGYPNNAWRTSPVSVIRSGSWKLMKYYETNQLQLYNLEDDIGENNNLMDQYPEMVIRLADKLNNWLTKNNAPLPRKP